MQKKTQEHVEHARVSLKTLLPQKKNEPKELYEAQVTAESQMRQEQQVPSRKKIEPSL